MIHTAGFWVTAGMFLSLLLLRWAIASPRKKFWILLRIPIGLLSLVAIWFLAVDWSWFQWDCQDCHTDKDIIQYRILGLPITNEVYDEESFFNIALTDLGVPCLHANTTYFYKHRLWGLTLCACPCWNFTEGGYGPDERYTQTISARVRERGRSDPVFAAEVHNQLVKKHNFVFFWDALMADEMVQDSLNKNDAVEAMSWVKAATDSSLRIFASDGSTHEEVVAFVEDLYLLGSLEVLVMEIEHYNLKKIDDGMYKKNEYDTYKVPHAKGLDIDVLSVQEADYVAIKLPPTGKDRENIFLWEASYQTVRSGNPAKDYGQTYLLVSPYNIKKAK